MNEKITSIDRKIELITAVLMAVVVIATAWSAYQATLWGGIQVFLLRDVAAAGNKFLLYSLQQGQRSNLDVTLFLGYITALHSDDKELSEFYLERIRPELRTAIQAWLATDPFENPNAPLHPFVMPEYVKTLDLEAEKYAKEAQDKLEEAQQANQNSDNYVLMTVLYASVLFSGGIITKFSTAKLRLLVLVAGLIIFSVTTAILFTLPIATK
jgi:hypothetical protein